MFRGVLSRVSVGFRHSLLNPRVSLVSVRSHSADIIFDDEFDCKYQEYFSRPDIDHWEIRKAMNDLAGMDNIPHPKIIIAAMQACRRLNDFALAIRFLETCKEKCGPKVKEIYPYLLQEINPCLCELGIETPEELGYDKPELHLVSGFDYDCPALCP